MFNYRFFSSQQRCVSFQQAVRSVGLAVAIFLVIPVSNGAFAAPVQTFWFGGNGVWSDSANWSNGVPVTGYQAVINGGTTALDVVSPVLDSVGICTGTTCPGASLIVNSTLSADSMQSFGVLAIRSGAIVNAGTISTLTGFVQETPAVTVVDANGKFLDAGWYSQGGGSTTVNGLLTASLFNITGGTMATGAGGVANIGTGGYTQGGAAATTVSSGGQLSVSGVYGQGSGTTGVAGLLGAAQFGVTGGTVLVSDGGAIDVGPAGYAQGVEDGPGTTTTIAKGGSVSVNGGIFSQEIGAATVVDGLLSASQVRNSGTVSGDGTISGAFVDLGTLDPGNSSRGTLTIMGDYSQTGFLDSEFDGLTPGFGNFLAVDGAATLDGTLNVMFGGGFIPRIGDTFPVMSFDSFSGTFHNIVSENLLAGEALEAVYGTAGVSVLVVGSVNTVPEPSSLGMAALAILSLLGVRQRHRIHAVRCLQRVHPISA